MKKVEEGFVKKFEDEKIRSPKFLKCSKPKMTRKPEKLKCFSFPRLKRFGFRAFQRFRRPCIPSSPPFRKSKIIFFYKLIYL